MEKLKNIRESLNTRKMFAAFGLIGALTLAGCGDDNYIKQEDNSEAKLMPAIKTEYLDGGMKLTYYENFYGLSEILSFCDGNDLVDQTKFMRNRSGAAGNAIARSVGHPACADGSLTESDFIVTK